MTQSDATCEAFKRQINSPHIHVYGITHVERYTFMYTGMLVRSSIFYCSIIFVYLVSVD